MIEFLLAQSESLPITDVRIDLDDAIGHLVTLFNAIVATVYLRKGGSAAANHFRKLKKENGDAKTLIEQLHDERQRAETVMNKAHDLGLIDEDDAL